MFILNDAVLVDDLTPEELAVPFLKLKLDLSYAKKMGKSEARNIIDIYYSIQKLRVIMNNRIFAAEKNSESSEITKWIYAALVKLEGEIKKSLQTYADNDYMGQWSQGIIGIGPVIASGLSAYIDITVCPTVGHIWSFAGIVGTLQKKWEKGQKRPWNANFKTLCYKIGESFVKVSGKKDSLYGKIYKERKELEISRNNNFTFKELAEKRVSEVSKSTEAYKYYSKGQLPPAHIHARARRYTVKLFLAHWHEMAYRNHFNTEPPKPFIFEHKSPFESGKRDHVHLITAKDAK